MHDEPITGAGEPPRIVQLQLGPAKSEVAALTSAVRDLIDHQNAQTENARLRRQDEARVAAQLPAELQQRVARFWPLLRSRLEFHGHQEPLTIHRGMFQDAFGALPFETERRVLEALGQEAFRHRDAWDPDSRCTGLGLRLTASAPPPPVPRGPAVLKDCRVVEVPVLRGIFNACLAHARTLGLEFPSLFWLDFVDAPGFRDADGTTTYGNPIHVRINANVRDIQRLKIVSYHELDHVSCYHVRGLALSVKEMEQRAESFTKRAMAPPPPPPQEPELSSSWRPYRGGCR